MEPSHLELSVPRLSLSACLTVGLCLFPSAVGGSFRFTFSMRQRNAVFKYYLEGGESESCCVRNNLIICVFSKGRTLYFCSQEFRIYLTLCS